jgi:peptidoglycan/xylan/chitin deacetylase (PgdA/CDA1 family)
MRIFKPPVLHTDALSGFTILDPHSPLIPENAIVLSFDDGPNSDESVSERLLDVLEKHGVPATFCMIGGNVQRSPHTARRAFQSGHELAIHTFTHSPAMLLSTRRAEEEIESTIRAIREAIGSTDYSPRLFRPPFGIVTGPIRKAVRTFDLTVTPLSFFVREAHVSSRGFRPYVEAIRRGILAHGGGAFVMHEMRYFRLGHDLCEKRWLPDAVDEIITWAKDKGFHFVRYGKEVADEPR